jgi:hypothetical protein
MLKADDIYAVRVVAADNAPTEGAVVSSWWVNPSNPSVSASSTSTTSNRITFSSEIRRAKVFGPTNREGYARIAKRSMEWNGVLVCIASIGSRVSAHAYPLPVDAALLRDEPIIVPDETTRLRATVVDDGGQGSAGVRVGIALSELQTASTIGQDVYATALTDDGGTCWLPQVDRDTIVVIYSGEGDRVIAASTVRVPRAEHAVRVVMAAERAIVVTVKDATSNAVLDDVRVAYQARSSTSASLTFGGLQVTGTDGTLTIPVGDASIDSIEVSANARGYQPVQPTVTSLVARTTNIYMSLARALDSVEVHGVVRDHNAAAVAGPVRVLRSKLPETSRYERVWNGHSGPDGTFTCLLENGVDEESIVIQAGVIIEGSESVAGSLDARAIATRRTLGECRRGPVLLVLDEAGQLDVNVTGQVGLALEGARVVVEVESIGSVPFGQVLFGSTLTRTSQDGRWKGTARVPAGGRCRVWCAHDAAEPGRITTVAEVGEAASSVVEVQAIEADSVHVTLPEPPKGVDGPVRIALLQQDGRGPNYAGAGAPGQVVILKSVSIGEYELVAYIADGRTTENELVVIKQIHVRVQGLGGAFVLNQW